MCTQEAWFGAYSGWEYKWKHNDNQLTWYPIGFDFSDSNNDGFVELDWNGMWDDVSADNHAEGYICEVNGKYMYIAPYY